MPVDTVATARSSIFVIKQIADDLLLHTASCVAIAMISALTLRKKYAHLTFSENISEARSGILSSETELARLNSLILHLSKKVSLVVDFPITKKSTVSSPLVCMHFFMSKQRHYSQLFKKIVLGSWILPYKTGNSFSKRDF